MKSLISITGLIFLLSSFAVAGNDAREEDKAAIRAIIADLAQAWTAGDAEAWSEHITEDVDFTVWTGMFIKGRKGVTEGHKQIFATIYKDTKQKLDVRSIRFFGEDVAVVHVEGSVVKKGESFPDSPMVVPVFVFIKQGETWKTAVFHNLMVLEAAKVRICNQE